METVALESNSKITLKVLEIEASQLAFAAEKLGRIQYYTENLPRGGLTRLRPHVLRSGSHPVVTNVHSWLGWAKTGWKPRRNTPLKPNGPWRTIGNIHSVFVDLNFDPKILHLTAIRTPRQYATNFRKPRLERVRQRSHFANAENVKIHSV